MAARRTESLAVLEERAWDLRIERCLTDDEISRTLGVPASLVTEWLTKRLTSASSKLAHDAEKADMLRAQELARIDRLYAVAYERALGVPRQDEAGNILRDEHGQIMRDPGDWRAWQAASRLSKQRMALLGLDIQRVDVRVQNTSPAATKIELLEPAELALLEHLLKKAGATPSLLPAHAETGAAPVETLDAEFEESQADGGDDEP